jgi:ADP-ribose pyrophosphatase YjhB (NUDIX family)
MVEETGLFVRPGALVAVVELIDEGHHYVVLDYLCEVERGALRPGDDAAEAAFVPISRLRSFDVTDAVRHVVERAVALMAGTAKAVTADDDIDEPLEDEPQEEEPQE